MSKIEKELLRSAIFLMESAGEDVSDFKQEIAEWHGDDPDQDEQ